MVAPIPDILPAMSRQTRQGPTTTTALSTSEYFGGNDIRISIRSRWPALRRVGRVWLGLVPFDIHGRREKSGLT